MANRIEKSLASKVFSLQKASGKVPPDIRASARRVLEGKARSGDVEAIRGYLGISHGGGTALRGAVRTVQKIQGAFFDVTRDVEMIRGAQARGENVAVPVARLFNSLNDQVQTAVKSKWARKVAENAAVALGKDPVLAGRFMNALGRGLRLGGALATVAVIGAQLAESYINKAQKYAQKTVEFLDFTRRSKLDARRLDSRRDIIRGNVEKQHNLAMVRLERYFGINPWTGMDIETETMEAQQKEIQQRMRMAEHPDRFGVDPNVALMRYAKRKGKRVIDLTERERINAINDALPDATDLHDEFANGAAVAVRLAEAERRAWYTTDAERERLREEVVQEKIEEYIKNRIDAIEISKGSAEKMRGRRTPEESLKHRERIAFAEANWMSYRSRHRAWNND